MKSFIAALACGVLCTFAGQAATLSAPFSSDYTLVSLTGPPVPANYGGLTFLDDNTLLLGGSANSGGGVIDEVSVTRDGSGHINGFGAVTQYSTAPFIDGGLAFGPGGDLFFTGYPNDTLGEIKPGSTSPDKIVSLTGNVTSSVGTLAFVPAGFDGAGNFVIGSYSAGTFCTAPLTSDGSGTYDVGTCTGTSSTGGGPEGLIYVPSGSADFTGQNMLVSEYSAGTVDIFGVGADGLPTGIGQNFITGLSGAEGAVLDPVTNDFLFSTFGGGSQIVEVQGFAAVATPEPQAFLLMGLGLAGILARRAALRGNSK